ncbi:MAG: hypothetical protein ACLQGP_37250 [Isosphaeraceae bacterium]
MTRIVRVAIIAMMSGLISTSGLAQQQAALPQVADLEYDTTIARPAYTTRHPAVLFDEAHHNLHTAGGFYKPFVDLISHDGYRVASNKKPFTKDVLEPYDILVIANASGAAGSGRDAANPAFTAAECQAVEAWVKEGGSFLFITDHYPWGAAAQPLAKRFGVGMSQGQTLDPQNSIPRIPSQLVFSRENDLLGKHPINWGRGPSEQIFRVVTYSGQSLQGPRGSASFLMLAETAVDRSQLDNSLVPAGGRSQGIAFIHGKGRVVIMGEAAALTAQYMGSVPVGMNVEGTDNRQLSLNIMHWLSGLIPVSPRASAKKPGTSRRTPPARKAKGRTSSSEPVPDDRP